MTNLNISIQSQIKATVESEVEFAVDFNDAWQWLEYSRKDVAKRVLVANFEEGVDYSSFRNIVEREIGATRVEEIYLTKDCFKQLAMLSGTAKGKEVRLYFLQCEKELKSIKAAPQLPGDYLSALKALVAAEEEKSQLLLKAAAAESKVIEMAPKVELYNVICEAGQNVKVGELAKILAIRGMGQNNLFDFLRNHQVLMIGNIPYQQYINSGYFTCIQKEHNGRVYTVTLVTPSGVKFVTKTLQKAGYIIPSKAVA